MEVVFIAVDLHSLQLIAPSIPSVQETLNHQEMVPGGRRPAQTHSHVHSITPLPRQIVRITVKAKNPFSQLINLPGPATKTNMNLSIPPAATMSSTPKKINQKNTLTSI